MKEPITFDKVADIYDFYVKVDFDIPFFLKETEEFKGEILELMCGTGRVSIPLLDSGRNMTCVDYSKGMLELFEKKIKNKNYKVNLIQMDVINLKLNKKYGLILLPFHSFAEIISTDLQIKALQSISAHLEKNGTFILTLQNPKTRLRLADGITRVMGKFRIDENRQLIISYTNQYNETDKMVSGFQFYEIYDSMNILIEKRYLEINFRLITDSELRDMIKTAGLEIIKMYGDYSSNSFEEETSNFMIYTLTKR
ncbi:MAG TPA: methyltransferase domain-containing protein [Candidatus Saccharicenans sp.]|mgnify:CR=1 FL=1|jgi:ubiquinone/menaquinone biosynthesis C-methylase UbiE|nr:methyltransferase domain-containing protein [Candidatus Saccharicenans sp.]